MRPSSRAAHPTNRLPRVAVAHLNRFHRQAPPSGAIAGELGVGDDRLVSALRTRLCRELGIDCPIWSAGFGGAGPELVAAVSGAGVLGANGLPANAIAALVTRTRELTDRPFGLNLIIGEADDADREALLTAEVRARRAKPE